MIIKEFFKKIYLFLYVKVTWVYKEVKEILKKHDEKFKNVKHKDEFIDGIDKLSTGIHIDDSGKSHTYLKPMPERFWKFYKFKSKNYDDELFRKRNLLFMGMIPPNDVKKVKKELAKSEAYRHKKENKKSFMGIAIPKNREL